MSDNNTLQWRIKNKYLYCKVIYNLLILDINNFFTFIPRYVKYNIRQFLIKDVENKVTLEICQECGKGTKKASYNNGKLLCSSCLIKSVNKKITAPKYEYAHRINAKKLRYQVGYACLLLVSTGLIFYTIGVASLPYIGLFIIGFAGSYNLGVTFLGPFAIPTLSQYPAFPSVPNVTIPPQLYSTLINGPFIIVSPTGTKSTPAVANTNNGANFGPDTTSTKTSGIQEALTFSNTNGGCVFMLGGIFNITGSITLPNHNNMTLVGTGSGTPQTTLAAVVTIAGGVIQNVNNTFGHYLSNFEILGNSNAAYGFKWDAPNETGYPSLISNVWISDCTNTQWHLYGYESMTLVNCTEHNFNVANNGAKAFDVNVPFGNFEMINCYTFNNVSLLRSLSMKLENGTYQPVTNTGMIQADSVFFIDNTTLPGLTLSALTPSNAGLQNYSALRKCQLYVQFQTVTPAIGLGVTFANPLLGGFVVLLDSCLFNALGTGAQQAYFIQASGAASITGTIMSRGTYLGNTFWVGNVTEYNANGTKIQYVSDSLTVDGTVTLSDQNIQSPATSITSGVAAQNASGLGLCLYVPITFNGNAAGSVLTVAIGPTNAVAQAVPGITMPIGTVNATIVTYHLDIPPGWFYKFTITNGTIGTPYWLRG